MEKGIASKARTLKHFIKMFYHLDRSLTAFRRLHVEDVAIVMAIPCSELKKKLSLREPYTNFDGVTIAIVETMVRTSNLHSHCFQ